MRFTNFVQDDFTPCMQQRLTTSRDMVAHFRGSWEVWAQVETSVKVLQANPHCIFDREKPYPHSTDTCDFVIDPKNAAGNLIWCELKVMLQSGPVNLATRFMTDVARVERHFAHGGMGTNTGGAVAFSPDRAQQVAQALQGQIPNADWHKYSYFAFDVAGTPRRFALSDPVTVNNVQAIAAYRTAGI